MNLNQENVLEMPKALQRDGRGGGAGPGGGGGGGRRRGGGGGWGGGRDRGSREAVLYQSQEQDHELSRVQGSSAQPPRVLLYAGLLAGQGWGPREDPKPSEPEQVL